MSHFCEFCKNKVESLKDSVAFAIEYRVMGTGDIGSFIIYIHENCFSNGRFKNRAKTLIEHAKRVE